MALMTVIVKLPFAVWVWASVAEQCTVVTPIGNVEPELDEHVTGTEPSTRSVAETVKFTVAPDELVAFTVILEGNASAGRVVSTTVTLKLAVPVLP